MRTVINEKKESQQHKISSVTGENNRFVQQAASECRWASHKYVAGFFKIKAIRDWPKK